jgi:hypothetical protein
VRDGLRRVWRRVSSHQLGDECAGAGLTRRREDLRRRRLLHELACSTRLEQKADTLENLDGAKAHPETGNSEDRHALSAGMPGTGPRRSARRLDAEPALVAVGAVGVGLALKAPLGKPWQMLYISGAGRVDSRQRARPYRGQAIGPEL